MYSDDVFFLLLVKFSLFSYENKKKNDIVIIVQKYILEQLKAIFK
jgi:hypothetical protein